MTNILTSIVEAPQLVSLRPLLDEKSDNSYVKFDKADNFKTGYSTRAGQIKYSKLSRAEKSQRNRFTIMQTVNKLTEAATDVLASKLDQLFTDLRNTYSALAREMPGYFGEQAHENAQFGLSNNLHEVVENQIVPGRYDLPNPVVKRLTLGEVRDLIHEVDQLVDRSIEDHLHRLKESLGIAPPPRISENMLPQWLGRVSSEASRQTLAEVWRDCGWKGFYFFLTSYKLQGIVEADPAVRQNLFEEYVLFLANSEDWGFKEDNILKHLVDNEKAGLPEALVEDMIRPEIYRAALRFADLEGTDLSAQQRTCLEGHGLFLSRLKMSDVNEAGLDLSELIAAGLIEDGLPSQDFAVSELDISHMTNSELADLNLFDLKVKLIFEAIDKLLGAGDSFSGLKEFTHDYDLAKLQSNRPTFAECSGQIMQLPLNRRTREMLSAAFEDYMEVNLRAPNDIYIFWIDLDDFLATERATAIISRGERIHSERLNTMRQGTAADLIDRLEIGDLDKEILFIAMENQAAPDSGIPTEIDWARLLETDVVREIASDIPEFRRLCIERLIASDRLDDPGSQNRYRADGGVVDETGHRALYNLRDIYVRTLPSVSSLTPTERAQEIYRALAQDIHNYAACIDNEWLIGDGSLDRVDRSLRRELNTYKNLPDPSYPGHV